EAIQAYGSNSGQRQACNFVVTSHMAILEVSVAFPRSELEGRPPGAFVQARAGANGEYSPLPNEPAARKTIHAQRRAPENLPNLLGARRSSRRAPFTYQPACKPGSVGRDAEAPHVTAIPL